MTHTSIKENRAQHKVKGNQVIPKKITNSNIIGLMIFTWILHVQSMPND